MTRAHDDWSELARREPYYAVLTDPRYLRDRMDDEARGHFFASGDADAADLLDLARAEVPEFAPRSALDFGCGVGRLTLGLARRVPHVTGCDVAPEMLREARRNAVEAGAGNVQFAGGLDEVAGERFDLVVSLIVFQHVPVREGLDTFARLLDLLAPGGVAAVHFTLRRPGSPLRRLVRRARAASRRLHRVIQRLEGDPLGLPYMQMNEYDPRALARCVTDRTGLPPRQVPRNEGEIEGAVFVARRRP